MIAPLRLIIDRLTARRDRSPESTKTGCGFTQAEIDAASPVRVLDKDDDDWVRE